MTLNTRVVLHQWTDPVELHTWFNKEILKVADKNPIIIQTETSIGNQLGQGFDAIFDVEWEADHSNIVWFDYEEALKINLNYIPRVYEDEAAAIKDAENDREYYKDWPQGVIQISWDTSYGYLGPHGDNCSELHAKFIVRLYKEYLEPRNITFHWQNEYTGEWHEGLTGIEEFLGDGTSAADWFHNLVIPAIENGLNSK